MNTGQTMLAVGAMILLSILILRVNNTFLTTSSTFMDSKFEIMATSIATSEIEEISKLAFDKSTILDSTIVPATSLADLTTPGNLGPDTGEDPNDAKTFNDIDDYNGYTVNINADSTMPSANFKVRCVVSYVNPSTPNVVSSTATWNKKITVYVSSVSMPDTIRLSTIYSYWYF